MISAALWALALCAAGQASEVATVESDALSRRPYRAELPRAWRYHPGDDTRWAAPDFDDSDWKIVDTGLRADDIPEDWPGIGWFRLRVRVPDRLVGRPLALHFSRAGALEVYVDGRSAGTLGRLQEVLQGGTTDVAILGDFVMATVQRPVFTVAVRYACPDIHAAARTGFPVGFFAFIGTADRGIPERIKETRRIDRLYFFFIGFAMALAILHLLLFAFLPTDRGNLYFGLATLSVAALSLFVVLRLTPTEWEVLFYGSIGFDIALVLLANFGVKFFHWIVGNPHPLGLRIYQLVGLGLILTAAWTPVAAVYVYAMVGLFEETRMALIANRRGIRDAWILAVGTICSVVLSVIQMIPDVIDSPQIIENAYIYGFFGLLLSMSIYLAKGSARTQRELRQKLVEVRMLSEQTLDQERRVKSEEMRRVKLEEENKRQSIELVEAERRQQMLAQLEAANRELRTTQAQLVQSEKMASLGQLVAGIAHEINTPIGAIHSMHDSLSKAAGKLEQTIEAEAPDLVAGNRRVAAYLKVIRDAISVIESGSTRVARIVQRLKTFARLDEAEMQTVSLQEGLNDTLLLLHHQFKDDITVHLDYGDVPPIPCFPGQLNQVFLNLLVNARQAIEGPGDIHVRTRVVGDRVHVAIEDSGQGISKEHLTRIFDPGFTTKGVKVGTGLGLSICYQIVQDHQGEIRVESELGRGSVFTVVLPMNLDQRLGDARPNG